MSYLGKGSNVVPNSSDLNELIEDMSLLMASVYTMLDRTQRTPQRTGSSLGRRSHNNIDSSGQLERASSNSSSPKSPKTPRLNLPARATLSTPSSREIEREVNRMDPFCEMLERNLRIVASEQEQLIGRRLESTSPTTPRNAIERPQPVRTNRVRAPTPEEVIDLSDSMNMPVPIPRPYPFNDDVIVVTSDDEVVDLCKPNFRRNNGRSRKRRTTNNTEDNLRNDNAPRQCLTASRRLSSASSHRASSRRSLTSNEGSYSFSFTSASTTTNIGSANKAKVNIWSPGAQAEIRSLIRIKRRLRRKWQKSRNPIDKTTLNKATRKLKEKLNDFENKSISDYIKSLNY
ncbi:uncharacterized protein LOC126767893 [Bactrocera neohumeralis]|uniref:uncharacterized protein LOC126767893 n=1 Tax=Bactrocera neohumeralis TaxID=98809 RepID=UPI00216672CC|nr:uncharacterized protein LOC126767893 [Bactrocera neohumeralis]